MGLTQNQKVLRHMEEFGSITTFEAFVDYGITRLASRICDLKNAGYVVTKENETGRNRYGEPVRYTRYRLGGQQCKQ